MSTTTRVRDMRVPLSERVMWDSEQRTLIYNRDSDIGDVQEFPIDEVCELLYYLKSRESDLRRMLQREYPREVSHIMRQTNGFWIGVSQERQSCRVSQADFQRVLASEESVVKRRWLDGATYQVSKAVQLVQYDAQGNIIPNRVDSLTEDDTPPYLLQEVLQRLLLPTFWVYRPENKDAGKLIPLP